jgi:hypothetical protein
MRHRFKYFSCLDYAKDFMEGKMFCQTAAFFRDYEDKKAQQIIGDEYEGTRLYRPATGLEIHNHTRGTSGNLQMGMECLTRAHEIYVFCVSLSLNELLKREFKAVACAEIFIRTSLKLGGLRRCRKTRRKMKSTSRVESAIISRRICRGMSGLCPT